MKTFRLTFLLPGGAFLRLDVDADSNHQAAQAGDHLASHLGATYLYLDEI